MGGVRGALAQHAERIYQTLPTQTHQQLARALFSRLVDPGTLEADATKRRIPLSAFTLIDQAKTEVLAKVREIFTNERLLTTNIIGEVSMVEVSHEALIGAWIRLQEWLHEARDTMRLQQVISQDATAWKEHKRSTDRLYRGGQLAEALHWRNTTIPNIDEDAFLQASVKEQHRSKRRRIVIGGGVAAGMMGYGTHVRARRRVRRGGHGGVQDPLSRVGFFMNRPPKSMEKQRGPCGIQQLLRRIGFPMRLKKPTRESAARGG